VSSLGKTLYLKPTISGSDSFMTVCLYDYATNTWSEQPKVSGPAYRVSKAGLSYDSANDIVLLVGGQVAWNTRPYTEMWAYHPSENRWEELKPTAPGGKFPTSEVMCTAYNPNDNVFVMSNNNSSTIFAYRYKNTITSTDNFWASSIGNKSGMQIVASPNPFNPAIKISLSGMGNNRVVTYQMISANGKKVAEGTFLNEFSWNASRLPAGLYVVKVSGEKGTVLTKSIALIK
jgi:hypothetical protein